MSAPPMAVTQADAGLLLAGAEQAIRAVFEEGRLWLPDLDDINPALTAPGATFVTLESDHGGLLGCMGRLDVAEAVIHDAARNAVKAAFADPRFPGHLHPRDFEVMSIKVSVLGALEELPVRSYAQLREAVTPGIDGLVVSAGRHRATFLPAVWRMFDDAESFLDALWQKAGLAPRRWSAGTVIERYGATEFRQLGPRAPLNAWRGGFGGR